MTQHEQPKTWKDHLPELDSYDVKVGATPNEAKQPGDYELTVIDCEGREVSFVPPKDALQAIADVLHGESDAQFIPITDHRSPDFKYMRVDEINTVHFALREVVKHERQRDTEKAAFMKAMAEKAAQDQQTRQAPRGHTIHIIDLTA